MTHRLTFCAFLTLTLTLPAFAQKSSGTGGRSTPTPTMTPGTMSPATRGPDPTLGQKAFISGKVVLDDGTEITESASVQTICRGHKQTVAHTDSRGGFSFELGDRLGAAAAGASAADVDSSGLTPRSTGSQRDWRECELLATLPGFTSQSIDLSARVSTFESTDIGRLVLHRMAQVEGFTISATTAAAPKDAQKAYAKAQEKERKEKWDEAQQLLTKAVEIYPKYAVAWFDLGRLQIRNNDGVQARHSFEQSIAADSRYTNPYRGLAELELQQKQWPALVTVTGQLLALDPVSFPDAWFRNALGNYFLSNFVAAEKSARQGMKVDDQHKVPQLEHLLGVTLAQEHNYAEATIHIQNYLKMATQPSDIEETQKQLAEITRLSASVTEPAGVDKK
jgi:tetratricopeptide (TPR) repeat protein